MSVGRVSDGEPHNMSPSSRPYLSVSLILCVSGLSVAASVLAVQLSQTGGPGNHVSLIIQSSSSRRIRRREKKFLAVKGYGTSFIPSDQ